MNNIEIEQLKQDIIKYFDNPELAEGLGAMKEKHILRIKNEIKKIKGKKAKSNAEKSRLNQLTRKIETFNTADRGSGLAPVKTITTSRSSASVSNAPKVASDNGIIKTARQKTASTRPKKNLKVSVPVNRKPKVLLIVDVKGWAWWLKGEFLQKYLSDEFDIDLMCTVGKGCNSSMTLPKKQYDLYFSFGYSYIDMLWKVPRNKKATGVTAHRPQNVIFPKMKLAGHLHANSRLLQRELIKMGFPKVHYIPNGVDEKLFRLVKPIPLNRKQIICGHVGKESVHKGQKQYIYPAIKKAGAKKVTNIATYKDKIPHTEMYKIYQEMDVFIIASFEDGTPNPGLEAAACGRPIISNRIGNMPELIKDGVNGFLVKREIGDYVEKIKWMQANRDKMIKMGEEARKTIERHWTWKIQAENYRKMFREIFVKEG